jgi:CMP-N-acetylneuraminic acid synthetase
MDYYKLYNEDFDGNFYNLLNRYFSEEKRLPKQYDELSKTYLKIRNSLTHPEEFVFSEIIVFNILSTVSELINHIENLKV